MSKVNVTLETTLKGLEELERKIGFIVQVAAQKAYEMAVERTPARGETKYSTGLLRDRLRLSFDGKNEFTLTSPVPYGVYVEYGTGPKGRATGREKSIKDYDDPYQGIRYHDGVVKVYRYRGQLLSNPILRHTLGMEAQPFLRPALQKGLETIKELLQDERIMNMN